MNVSKLIIALQNTINTSEDTIDHLMAAKAIERLKTGSVDVVSSFAGLPPAADNKGSLFLVENESTVYWSTGIEWRLISRIDIDTLAYAWGCNAAGQLGDNTIVNKSSPVSVVGGFTDWCQVSGGGFGAVGIRANGTAWAWGNNTCGQLGDGTAVPKSSPVSVIGGFTDWCQVSAQIDQALGVRTNGTIWSWGSNLCGKLGDGTVVTRSSPVSVVGGFTDWCQVASGACHSLGLRTNGTLWSWGEGASGQLGDGTAVPKSSPVSVIGGFTDWRQISAGGSNSVGLRANGTIWSWGFNSSGRLGDGTVVTRSSPVSVVGGFTDWCYVSAGSRNVFGIRTNGTLWAWGFNVCGGLGDNTIVDKSSPVSVVGGFTDWCQVSALSTVTGASAGVRKNGTIWSWGGNVCGVLGDGTIVNRLSPVSVVGGFTDWCQVSAIGVSGNGSMVALRSCPRDEF